MLELRYVDPATLEPNPKNWRLHPDEQAQALGTSLDTVGWAGAALFNKRTGRLVDGHLRQKQAIERGEQLPLLVGEWTEEQEAYILATLDPIANAAAADEEKLEALLAELRESVSEGRLEADLAGLDGLLGEFVRPEVVGGLLPGADPDAVPEQVEGRCKRGDLWGLGRHRVLCGDSTSKKDVTRVLAGLSPDACVTDPPYNVGLVYDEATDDVKAGAEYEAFSRGWWVLVTAPVRIVTPGCSNLGFWLAQFKPQAMGVWTKLNSMTRASATRFNCWEPLLFYGCKNSDRAHDVFDYPTSIHFGGAGSGIVDPHPCPKPVSLWRELIMCYTPDEALLYEPFTGSGTTIIAAEESDRTCYGMEHSPHYCDISIARWEQATGGTAELLERPS